MKNHRLYRIGDFAEKLGVTPDLLKYCEKKGIITSVKSENGYRSYDFTQSANIIEYLKLQNQGFSADNIYAAMRADSFSELVSIEKKQQDELEKQILFYKALLERIYYNDKVKNMFSDEPKWTLSTRKAAWMLKNTDSVLFVEDNTINARIAQWNKYLPVVESACCYRDFSHGRGEWGLYIEDEKAKQFGLDVSAPAEYVPEGLVLEIYVTRILDNSVQHVLDLGNTMPQKLGLIQAGNAYHRVIAKMVIAGTRREYSVLQIPVEYI